MALGPMDGLSAEVWSIAAGLKLAWDKGHRRICIASDSKSAIELITKSCRKDHPLWLWVHQIQELLRRNWETTVEYTFREGNRVANWLAMAARDSVEGLRVLSEPPESVRPILKMDLGLHGHGR